MEDGELGSSSAAVEQPAVKRVRTETPNTLPSTAGNEGMAADVIERAQKTGLWKQMQEYKAHALAAEARAQTAEQNTARLRESLATQSALLFEIRASVGLEKVEELDVKSIIQNFFTLVKDIAGDAVAVDSVLERLRSVADLSGRLELLTATLEDAVSARDAAVDACDSAMRKAERLEIELQRASKAVSGQSQTSGASADVSTEGGGKDKEYGAETSVALRHATEEAESAKTLSARRLVELEKAEAVRVSLLVENENLKSRLRRIPDEVFGDAGAIQSIRSLQADVLRHQTEAIRWKRLAEESAANLAATEAAANLRLAEANSAIGARSAEIKQFVDAIEAEALRMRRERDSMREAYERANSQVISAVRMNSELQATINALQTQISALKKYASRAEAIDGLVSKVFAGDSSISSSLLELRDQESALYSEIEAMGSALDDALKRNDLLLKNMAEKEESVGNMLSEKLKADFTLVQIRKEAELASQKAVALERVSLDRMAGADVRERDARLTVADAETRLREKTMEYERSQWRVAELTAELAEARARNETLAQAVTAHESYIAERVNALETAAFERNRLKEEVEALQRKLRASTDHHGAGHREDTEVDIYRRLLKCNSCHTRDKNAVITKCMHVFCRQCLDTRIETRQRKCPNCGEAFGAGDIRNIYL